ncbi:MAG: hypothetical protein ACPG19_00680 [Saprospiraceae bacterium]
MVVFCLFMTSSFGAQCPPQVSNEGEAPCIGAGPNSITVTQESKFAFGGGCTDACGDCQVISHYCDDEVELQYVYWG